MLKQHSNCPAVLESYLRYLKLIENKADSTVNMRLSDIKGFLQFLKVSRQGDDADETLPLQEVWIADMEASQIAEITEDDIYDYQDHLIAEGKVSGSTFYRKKLPALRRFYAYLLRFQADFGIVLLRNPVPDDFPATESDRPAKALRPSELDRLLRSVEGVAAVRDVAIILLMVTTGLTTAEVARIRYSDYREDVLLASGRKVYLTEACQKAIEAYIRQYRDPIEEFLKDNTLFVSSNYLRRLTSRGIQKALQRHFDKAGIEATARDLRHTAVMELLKNARNECERAYIAGYLGYTNLASIDRLDLPKAAPDDTIGKMVDSSWLAELGTHHSDD